MSKGRNTTVITIRVLDDMLVLLKKRAKTAGIGYTILARHLLQEKLGLPKS